MKKVILEEIENMKYLLGYKRGVVISEQEGSNMNSNDSNKLPDTPTTTQPAVTTQPETPTQTIKMGIVNPRVQYLQQLLNDKFQSGLVTDGKYGPKTADAIYKNIIAISKTQLKPVEPINKTPQVVQQPKQQITATLPSPTQLQNKTTQP